VSEPIAAPTGDTNFSSPAATPKPAVKPAPGAASALVVTPASTLGGKVARYNEAGRFVVLECSGGRMPAPEQRLSVYRRGQKVGELKVTGPQRGNYIVADVADGEARAGDEVRDQ